MTEYRRPFISGATWFFTVNLAARRDNSLLTQRIDSLREGFRYVLNRKPFRVDAIVVLPDHLHCLWTLPPGDADYSTRWNLLKGYFSRSVETGERISESRAQRRERGVWQRRFWEHWIRDERDFEAHMDYIHWNPVKHGWAQSAAEWPHSSFHRWVERGVYTTDWGHHGKFDFDAGE